MTPITARKLMAAGFATTKNIQAGTIVLPIGDGSNWCSPTLDELIAVCGQLMLYQTGEGVWRACAPANDGKMGWVVGDNDGDTPDEAVAKLWLALNKHD